MQESLTISTYSVSIIEGPQESMVNGVNHSDIMSAMNNFEQWVVTCRVVLLLMKGWNPSYEKERDISSIIQSRTMSVCLFSVCLCVCLFVCSEGSR